MSAAQGAAQGAAAQENIREMQRLQVVVQEHNETRQKLFAQLQENDVALQEINALESDATVYRVVGGILAEESQEAAKANVQKRKEFITEQITSCEKIMDEAKTEFQKYAAPLMQQQQQQQPQPTPQ